MNVLKSIADHLKTLVDDAAGIILWGVIHFAYGISELAWLWFALALVLFYPALVGLIQLFY